MAATLTVIKSIPLGQSEVRDEVSILMDNSYATGGEPVLAPSGAKYNQMDLQPVGGYVPEYVQSTGAVLMRWDRIQNAAAGVQPEVTAATDLSAVTVRGYGYRTT